MAKRRSWRKLFEDHLPWAEGMGKSMVRRLPPSFDESDMIQCARIGLMKAAREYDASKNDNFRAFAHSWVQGEVWMAVRRRNYTAAMGEELEPEAPAPAHKSPEDQVRQDERGRLIYDAVATLDRDKRRVIEMHYLLDSPVEQIALDLGISTAKVYSIRKEALAELHSLMAGLKVA